MARIDYFFATLSPYSYLAGTRLEEVAAKHGVTINYKPLDIIAWLSLQIVWVHGMFVSNQRDK